MIGECGYVLGDGVRRTTAPAARASRRMDSMNRANKQDRKPLFTSSAPNIATEHLLERFSYGSC